MRLIDPDIFDKDPDGISIGVLHIKIYPFAYTFNYNGEDSPLEYRQSLLLKEIEDDIAWITSRYQDKKEIYAEHGFDDSKFNRLIELMKKKEDYVFQRFATDNSFEWTGGFNFIVTGVNLPTTQ